jgi:general nucleoside transport system ATP-binding protein
MQSESVRPKLNSATDVVNVVELTNISKSFPGVIANRDISLQIDRATIHAIVGENGAGKSTLMKILYGLHQPDSGTIAINGVVTQFKSPSEAMAAGIGMVHQHFMLADNLTVLENIILGSEPTKYGVLSLGDARKRVKDLATSIGVEIDLDLPISDLGVGQRQRVEILKVLFRGAEILVLDEPTAVLVANGTTILFISHKLDEVLSISDQITVIRQGSTVATVSPKSVDRLKLAELMVGSDLPSHGERTTKVGEKILLSVRNLTVLAKARKNPVQNVSFDIFESEIIGIAGVDGNGQFELCEALLGLVDIQGTVELGGKDASNLNVRERLDQGLAYIPFDRHREGLMLAASLWENGLLGHEATLSRGPMIDVKAARKSCREIIERFGVMTPSELVPAFVLSGGNQQKLVVGRNLANTPKVLIAAHPTRGIDVGAQAAVWKEIRRSRDAGMSVLLVSADLEEVLGLSDRILVMFDGEISAELDPKSATPQILGKYMTGMQ